MPSPLLAAVIGPGPFGRGEVMQKLWDYIKTHGLQDPQDKRTILADAKLRPLFETDSVGMFKLAGIAGRHLK
jgi:DNA topoisomerase-3